MRTVVVAARVAPRSVANGTRIRALVRRTVRLIRSLAGGAPRRLEAGRVVVDHTAYGGAYGRPLAAGAHAATLFRALYDANESHATPPVLDATYSAKAAAVALSLAEREGPAARVLLWATFDARLAASNQMTQACNPAQA
jgi:hypothetical protein